MNLTLHALPDDLVLNANGDTEKESMHLAFPHYLTDGSNYLTDIDGNRLIVSLFETVSPQVLHALPDDFILTAE